MTTIAARIRAIDPSLPPKRVADVLGCCPRYVSQIRYNDRNRERVRARHAERDRRRRAAAATIHRAPSVCAYGSPQFAAWCQHWRNIGRHELARSAELTRGAIEVDDAWPPASAEVFEAGGFFTIPHGTPEWASHLAALRIRRGPRIAQAHEISRRDFIAEPTRWGEARGEQARMIA